MPLVNAYHIRPENIKPGDEMLFVVKAMVNYRDHEGKLRYRLYRCPWNGSEEDIPQGSQISDMETVCEELFPSLAAVGKPG